MHLFTYPPYKSYGHIGNPRKEELTIQAVEIGSPIAESLQTVAEYLGGTADAEVFYFPMGFKGDYTLPEKTNSHIFQLLGSCRVAGRCSNPGDMVRLTDHAVDIQSCSHAPCVFVRFSVDQPTENPVLSRTADQTRLVEMIMVDDYLSVETCEKMIASLYSSGSQYGKVLTNATENKTETMFEYRKTEIMHSSNLDYVREVLSSIVVNRVEPFFKTTVEFWNEPVLLKYDEGDFFVPHTDGEIYEAKSNSWVRIYDRDYTLVVFLNETYEGGQLSFPDQNFAVSPKQGRVVAFPADHRFRHGADTVTSGTRYQLVSWLTGYGTLRTSVPPNPSIIYRTW